MNPPDSAPIGRPSRYTPPLAREICRRLAEGQSLLAVCGDAAMPCYSTVMSWLDRNADFRARYARARTHQAHALADEVLEALRAGELPPADKQARIKGLTWMAGKLQPRKYGERNKEPEAADGPPVVVEFVTSGEGESAGE
jgi:hypothetical protein